jgi:hypothetical protein
MGSSEVERPNWRLGPCSTANAKRLTATANRLILAPDERSLQVDLVRLDWSVPGAGRFQCLSRQLASAASASYGGAMNRRAAAPHQRPADSRRSSRLSPMSASMRNRWSTRTISSRPCAHSSARSMACSSGSTRFTRGATAAISTRYCAKSRRAAFG